MSNSQCPEIQAKNSMKLQMASELSYSTDYQTLFNNLPEIMKAVAVAELLGLSVKTIYDWRYKQKTRKIPSDLFIKINRLLFVRTVVLRKWITSQNRTLI